MSSRKISQNSHRSATQLTAFTASLALDVFSLLSRLAMAGNPLMRQYWSISLAFCVGSLAAKMAAERKFQHHPAVIKPGHEASRGKNIKEMVDSDVAFHAAIYDPLATR